VSRRLTYGLIFGVLALSARLAVLAIRCIRHQPPAPPPGAAIAFPDLFRAIAFAIAGYLAGRKADRLITLAETDPLTGLHNGRSLWRRLGDEVARCRRYHAPLAVLFVDLDQLKTINDNFGHLSGDGALRRLAEAIHTQLRSSDLAARWGGDEFAVVAPNTSAEAAAALGERVRVVAARQLAPWQATASIGVAAIDQSGADDADAEELVQAVDAALYEAKRRGRNRVVVAAVARRSAPAGASSPPAAPFRELERSYIEQFATAPGGDRSAAVPEGQRSDAPATASVLASGRLAEIEARFRFVEQLRGGVPLVALNSARSAARICGS
jgi:diguanylate cyclase (GGDEF)-like protein